jgi:hypothetical protein
VKDRYYTLLVLVGFPDPPPTRSKSLIYLASQDNIEYQTVGALHRRHHSLKLKSFEAEILVNIQGGST